jgi:hypothetical protein
MARIHGKNGQVQIDTPPTTSPPTLVTQADLNNWSLDMTKDKVDVTAFGDTNKQKVVGLPDFSGTLGGWWNSVTSPALFDVILQNDPCWLRLLPNSAETSNYFQGQAYLDGSVTVPNDGAAAISATFDAANNWDQTP